MKTAQMKRKHISHYAIFILYLPVMALTNFLFGEKYLFYVFLFWCFLWLLNGLTLVFQPCPFCGEKYFKVSIGYNIWAFRCSNCKKSIYSQIKSA